MVYFDSPALLRELQDIIDEFPLRSWDRDFIINCPPTNHSLAQYNTIISLYNKHIAITASVPHWRHDGTHRQ